MQPSCLLYVVVEAGPGAAERLGAALAAVQIASVLITPAADAVLDAASAKPLVELAQRAGAAALIADDAGLARGIARRRRASRHLHGPGRHLCRGAPHLGPRGIVGVDAGISRDDAMTLAEAGAEYVAFGAPLDLSDLDKARARRADLIAWWAEIFEVPCVAFDVESAEAAEALARAGADFVRRDCCRPPSRRPPRAIWSPRSLLPSALPRLRHDPCVRRCSLSPMLLAAGPAAAETSSWTSTVEAPDAALPKQAPDAAKAPAPPPRSRRASRPRRRRRSAKQAARKPQARSAVRAGDAPAPRSGHRQQDAAHAQGPAVAGDDAAYEAFDQGKYLTALELALKAAGKGDPQAHTLVGRIYADGLGTSKNLAAAAQWYARGAELGDTEAMFAVAVMLAEGQGVQKDRAEAARLFEMAAARKHPLANYNLALLFLTGDGKPENPYRAAMHMRFAAESGVVVAQYDLGTLYATGTGVEPNAFEAAKWIGKAATAGHPEAQVDYAVMLFRGQGVDGRPEARRRDVPRRRGEGARLRADPAGALPGAGCRRAGQPGRCRQVAPDRQVGRPHRRGPGEDAGQAVQGRPQAKAPRRRTARSASERVPPAHSEVGMLQVKPGLATASRRAAAARVMRSFIQRAVRATPPKL